MALITMEDIEVFYVIHLGKDFCCVGCTADFGAGLGLGCRFRIATSVFSGTAMRIKGSRGILKEDVAPLSSFGNHAIDGTPVGQPTKITVIDKKIHLQFP
jgi:hypothetical protein